MLLLTWHEHRILLLSTYIWVSHGGDNLGNWCSVVWWKCTVVTEDPTASIIRMIHSVTSYKTAVIHNKLMAMYAVIMVGSRGNLCWNMLFCGFTAFYPREVRDMEGMQKTIPDMASLWPKTISTQCHYLTLRSPGIIRMVIIIKCGDDIYTALKIHIMILWRWRQYVPLKLQYMHISLHITITQKTSTLQY
jgi:hypothetical protein